MDSKLVIGARLQKFLPSRLRDVVGSYVFSLMMEAPKHTLSFASEVSGLDKAQFSRLLSEHRALSEQTFEAVAKRAAISASRKRMPIEQGCPWTVALIIDATLHARSSRHIQNSQRLCHGDGFVVGHQWTNIILHVNGKSIPLPPIPFFTKNECKRRGIAYRTEHEVLQAYLKSLDLSAYIGSYDDSEVVVLTDSGYDDKALQNQVLERGWDFIGALKCRRAVLTLCQLGKGKIKYLQLTELFRRVKKQAPWKTIRLEANAKKKKRKKFRIRSVKGRLKGVPCDALIICSEKSSGKGRRYFACSNTKISDRTIMSLYQKRWLIELFHRSVKSQLGLMDLGAKNFDSMIAHLHWCYIAYILLQEMADTEKITTIQKQRSLRKQHEKKLAVSAVKSLVTLQTQFGWCEKIKNETLRVYEELKAA